MSKMMTGVAAAAALIASTAFAFADGQASNSPFVKTAAGTEVNAVCHHDGEVVQGPNGLLVCHQRRPISDVHFKSSDWFRAINARAAGSNE
jgi:hypothetical protein